MIAAKVDDRAVRGLINGYKKETAFYKSMLEITQMQSEGLRRRGDVREFVSLLQKKEDIIRGIDKLEARLAPLKQTWRATSAEEREHLKEHATKLNRLLDSVIVLIEKIMRQERDNEKMLQTRRDQLGEEIGTISRGKRLHKAFTARQKPRFLDACR